MVFLGNERKNLEKQRKERLLLNSLTPEISNDNEPHQRLSRDDVCIITQSDGSFFGPTALGVSPLLSEPGSQMIG